MVNARPILTDLRSRIQAYDASQTVYLSRETSAHHGDRPASVLDMSSFGINEVALPGLLQFLGIRSITLDSPHDLTPLADMQIDTTNIASERYPWIFVRNNAIIAELRALFRRSRTVAFDNWSSLVGASDLWSGLLYDVIKPINKKDLEFIFYLGNPENRLSFQVDEVLDIISDFSLYSKVTFALDEGETVKLWKVLNGIQADAGPESEDAGDLNRKCISIYRTLNVTRLLVYSASKAVLYSNQQQFTLARMRAAPVLELATDARQNFIAGFSMSLLLQLEIAHCVAFGLVVFGSFGQQCERLDQQNLLAYIDQWIDDLERPDTMHLYQ
ncbi:hypothetical protein SAMN04487996_101253 [Dyadobacter soli]|uniref:Uncharacterized protein n=2 Tax=Dyadobacter soli TaxID=659014 RepID=A0A1G6VII0_9BACT|nr:hypothetical protein SAMN04487996_101253 [Dyadobacter soli]